MTFFIGLAAVIIGFSLQGANIHQFINMHGLIVVFGGSIAILLMTTPAKAIRSILKGLARIQKDEVRITAEDLKGILHHPQGAVVDPYGIVQQARDLWELDVSPEEAEQLLVAHAESCLAADTTAIHAIRNLGKYPPALGMVGTVMGMIELFGGLGTGQVQNQIGAQLALAMTATLYGLVLSNYLLVPIADRMETNKEIRRENLERLVQVLGSVHRKQPKFVAERVIHAA